MISIRNRRGSHWLCLVYFLLAAVFIPACQEPARSINATLAEPAVTQTIILPTSTRITRTPTTLATNTPTPGPSPTSTALPPLQAHSWQAKPLMIEWAEITNDPVDPFGYTPHLILYGDGMLVKRSCQESRLQACRYLQQQLDEEELCQWINAINRTGFLHADPLAVQVPGGTGAETRLAVQVYSENGVQIPDLDRWSASPDWYGEFIGCSQCFDPPAIDPAFINLYRLLSNVPVDEMTGLATDRLAVWLTIPVIDGDARAWDAEQVSLTALAERSACPNDPARRQAVILEGSAASQISSFLSIEGGNAPVFSENGQTWQIHSKWLLPYEMPLTCQRPAGLYPPADFQSRLWRCEPGMGAIPTATPTITPTPSVTPTPLR